MSTQKEQLDLFVALVGDVPLRDDREMMSAPMVSIAKKGQERIEWQGPSGQQVVITSTSDEAFRLPTLHTLSGSNEIRAVLSADADMVRALIARIRKP